MKLAHAPKYHTDTTPELEPSEASSTAPLGVCEPSEAVAEAEAKAESEASEACEVPADIAEDAAEEVVEDGSPTTTSDSSADSQTVEEVSATQETSPTPGFKTIEDLPGVGVTTLALVVLLPPALMFVKRRLHS